MRNIKFLTDKMRVNKNVNDLNYLGKYSGVYYYEDRGTVYAQLSINEYERWGDFGLFQVFRTKGIIC